MLPLLALPLSVPMLTAEANEPLALESCAEYTLPLPKPDAVNGTASTEPGQNEPLKAPVASVAEGVFTTTVVWLCAWQVPSVTVRV